MVKSCCTLDQATEGSGLSFQGFPTATQCRAMWVAAVNRESWQPSAHSWICSAHFITRPKSDDLLSPDYVPNVFNYVSSPLRTKNARSRDVQ